ncbi:MG2 domain-containing protein [Archangium sp.]|uniref:alpha-2-macroglobulin family protein n=1 Tax=Archangium sp. TaxID=1872627 RepID=UPI002D5EF25E|nr:MG2 domain-containing protein [Archangium sp.]HYO54987.1 MG2 domain-containing protein [Archangium sp.]
MGPRSVPMPKPSRTGRTRWLLAALLVGTLAGCKKDESTSTPVPSGPSTTPGAPASGSSETSAPPSAESLTPVIRELGPEGMVPREVVLEFPRGVAPEDNEVRKGTAVTVSPEVPGSLSFRGASTLVFTPRESLAFNTRYTVTLEALELANGTVVKPKAPGEWSRSFTTPAFAFLRLSPRQMDVRKGKVEADLVFSGPVDVATVRRFAAFSVDGKSLSDVKLRSHPSDRHVVTAALGGASLRPGAEVKFILKPGLTSAGRDAVTAAAGEGSFALYVGKRLDITNAYAQEGSTGHYIEVRCREVSGDAAPSAEEGEEEYDYYEGRGDRCSLDDDSAADTLHFNPPVKFSVSPSRWGFRVFGDFKRGSYAMRIDAGAASTTGGTLLSTYEKSFSISARGPQLSFGSTGRYLPRSAWRNLPLNHLNLDSVDLVVRHVPQENLLFWMSHDGQEAADERTSNVLLRKKLPLQGAQDTLATTWLDVGSLVPASTRGVVEITAMGRHKSAASRILLTDLSLVAKRGLAPGGSDAKEEVWVWALGMESTELLSGVEVSLVKKSGQVVARCTTGGADGCKLTVPAPGVDTAEPFALLARKGDEFTYLKYSELKTEIANSDVQGEPYRSEKPYRASLYSDRGVYRPGDTAHVVAVLRGQDDLAPPVGMPVELKVVDPRERDLKKVTLKTNEAGLVSMDVPFEAYQDTGAWRVVLSVAGKQVATYGLNVEEFVPERMKVTARAEKPGYVQGEEVPLTVEAAYLFGGSAESSPVEVTCRLEPSVFRPKDNAQYVYGVWRPEGSDAKATVLGQVKGELDAKGRTLVRCPAQQDAGGFKGPAKLVAQASVFEAGSGRSTLGEAHVPVHPEAYYVGLQANVEKVQANQPFTVSGVVVDWQGALYGKALKPLEVEYLRLDEEYGYFYEEESGEDRYQRHLRPVREGRTTVKPEGGKFSFQVTPSADAAGYVVRVKSGAAQTDLQLSGNGRYYWSDESSSRVDQTPRPARPTSLAVELPRSAKVGDSITVKVKAPYRGRMLFTAETDGVRAAEWKAVEPGEVTWSFKPSAYAPNVYVSAFLVKDPHLESAQAFMPDRAFGVASMPLEPVDFTQAVTLNVPKEVRSNDTLPVDLDLGPVDKGTFATVAVVDEGILSLTRFKSPDPLAELFTRRALGVQTYETLGWTLLIPPAGASRSTGGDGEGGGAAGRVQPVKPVALWSGVLPVPSNGKLRVPFKLPQYRGAVRVMVVTSGPKRIGHASAQVLVRDPLVLQTTLPRFLSQGDEIQVPVFITNLSGEARDVKVSLTAENLPVPGMAMPASMASPLQLLGKSEGRVRLEDGKAATLVFQAKAVQAVGAARLKVTAEGGGHTSFEQLDVPLLPSGPRERKVQRIELANGTVDLSQYLQGWLPTSERSTFWVTTNPYAESFQHLSYLVQYPHGCIEQTTSSTRPLLYVSELIDSVDPTLTANAKVEDMVLSGVNRVLSMQTPSGGFGYWPGATEPVEWGSAYATHMLLDAQKRKYAVPQDRIDNALEWMNQQVARRESRSGSDRYNDGAEAYMHYVLAMAGKGHKARVQKLIDQLGGQKFYSNSQRAEQEYVLKSALYLAGDRRYEKDLRDPDVSVVADERWNSWSFYSDRRRRGFMLSTFQDLFGDDAAGEPLAQRVAEALKQERSSDYTTQELVWGITGLGKRVAGAASKFAPPVLTADGKEVATQQGTRQRASDRTWALVRASERKGLTLKVPEKGEGRLYLVLASEGVRVDGQYRTGGEGLSLTRQYRNLEGDVLDVRGGTVNLADLVYVEVKLKNTSRERIQNIALVDRLPAGWEIENARLGRGGSVAWASSEEQWSADYVNIRDDRVEVFGGLDAGETKTVVYAVRAVTSGKFTLPPVEAEAMYDPRIWAREAGGTVEVSGPWADFLL